ncbi:universal stress protein [Pseudactinotalea sp.]|uniref:universal stress protein n=1 Tax=Pseudactinotalea sp. TaxID=1926260 RepID=UPI003B3B5ABC
MSATVPQPSVERMVPFDRHPLVVGVVPGQDPLVVRTAVQLALATRAPSLHMAFADPARYTVAEHADGSVRHAAIDPDADDEAWRETESALARQVEQAVGGDVPWHLHYLAGRPDRALTHLARAVDAAAVVVGTRAPGSAARLKEFLEGSVAAHLAHHQHRPVLTVPLSVVDWKEIGAPWAR